MSVTLEQRLNQILPRITSPEFLANKGLGNEIGFWIFDFPPDRELDMRAFVSGVVLPALDKLSIKAAEINLFQLIIGLLEERKLLDRAIEMQATKHDRAALVALRSVLKEDKLAQRITTLVDVDELQVLILTGIGAAYPMLRSHTLLSALHSVMRRTPLLMFYPGRYDGFSLRLFNTLADDHYYRAFRLVE
jgi:bacteriophage exclusion system BrxB-like protein